MRAQRLVLPGILAATAATYAPHLGHPFLYDDVVQILGNPTLREPFGFFRAFAEPGHREEAARLVPNLTFALDHALYGWKATGFHATQLLFHLANVLLVALLGAALMRRAGEPDSAVPLLAAGIFGVHPLLSEAVLYDNARPNVVATTFYLLAVLALLRVDGASGARRSRWLAVFTFAFVLALLSKELAITVVVMAPLALAWLGADAAGSRRATGIAAVLVSVGLVLGVASGAGRSALEALRARPEGVEAGGLFVLGATVLEQSEVFLRYLGLALVPWPGLLNVDHAGLGRLHERLWPSEGGVGALGETLALPFASLAVCAAALSLCFAWRRRAPLASYCALWPFVTHAPTSLVPRDDAMVEYRAYLPMVGLCWLGAWTIERLVRRVHAAADGRAAPRALGAVGVVLCAFFAAGTSVRALAWSSVDRLWTDSVAKAPRNPRALTNLGLALGDAGKSEQAEARFREALVADPSYTQAHNNLGNLLLDLDRAEESLAVFRAGLGQTPDLAVLHSNLGRALLRTGALAEAIGHHQRALALAPDSAAIRVNLAAALSAAGRAHEAVEQLEQALAIYPDALVAHVDLAHALASVGRTIEAIEHYRHALALAPDEAGVHTSLGALLAEQADAKGALEHLERAVALAPESADAHSNLAALLARQGRYADAIRSYRRALELRSDHPAAQAGLAAALELAPPGTTIP